MREEDCTKAIVRRQTTKLILKGICANTMIPKGLCVNTLLWARPLQTVAVLFGMDYVGLTNEWPNIVVAGCAE